MGMTTHSPIVRALAALTPLTADSIAESIESRRMLVDRWRVGFHLNNTEATTWHAYIQCRTSCFSERYRCARCSLPRSPKGVAWQSVKLARGYKSMSEERFHLLYCFNGTARIAVESLGK